MIPFAVNNLLIRVTNELHCNPWLQGEGAQKHVGRIVEFFKTVDGEDYFRVQWFYRAEDTVCT